MYDENLCKGKVGSRGGAGDMGSGICKSNARYAFIGNNSLSQSGVSQTCTSTVDLSHAGWGEDLQTYEGTNSAE